VHGITYIGGGYIVNKRGSFILTFPRQIFSSQQHPLFITRWPFRSVSVLSSLSLSLSLSTSLFFSSPPYSFYLIFSLRLLLLSQTIVCTCVRVCVFVFCVSVYRHVFINPHVPRRCRRRRQPYTIARHPSPAPN